MKTNKRNKINKSDVDCFIAAPPWAKDKNKKEAYNNGYYVGGENGYKRGLEVGANEEKKKINSNLEM